MRSKRVVLGRGVGRTYTLSNHKEANLDDEAVIMVAEILADSAIAHRIFPGWCGEVQ